jgi:DNA-binding transcriptional regulator YiaG
MYHYKESGLDDVVLRNGYTIRETPYGETVSIENVDALHQLIGKTIIGQPQINGAELRFLRRELDKTQAELAALLGTSEQAMSLWERNRKGPMPESAARLLRLLYAESIGLRPKASTWLHRLALGRRLQETRAETYAFRHEARRWKPAA